MSRLTRRGFLGAGTGLIGASLASCSPRDTDGPVRPTVRADSRAPYPGQVAFQHGVASGDPLQNWVVLWTRVTPVSGPGGPIPVAYGVFADAAMEQPLIYGLTTAEPSRDYCVKVDVDGLEPGKDYFYRFIAKGESGDVATPLARTRTLPADGATGPVKFAIVSCSNYPFGRFNVYREIGQRTDLDAVVHLGDYIYEYGVDGYGGEAGATLGRDHEPALEIVTLTDYRARHAQYKSDPDLQAAHAAAPWFCTWDDHESTNNSYRSGAENHNPEENEGDWSDRKQAAVQAYLEWMPVRDPAPGRLREAVYRRFDFGGVASLFCLETRLLGRSDEISWFTELGGKPPEQVPMAAAAALTRVAAADRTMLGAEQEAWLATELEASVKSGRRWQVLANQVIMAKVRPPNFTRTLTPEQIALQTGYVAQLVPFSVLGLPWNLDAWDGFPAARERLYQSAKAAGARLVTLTGDTHTAWANELHDDAGERRGVEFGCTSVTSPGFGTYMKGVEDIGTQFAEANKEVIWYDPSGNGFTLVTLTPETASAEFIKVDTVQSETYTAATVARFAATIEGEGVSGLVQG
jgi:phosphodiesterase/alkaline phosphatase D-like protein